MSDAGRNGPMFPRRIGVCPTSARHLVQCTARMDHLLEDRGTDTRWPHTTRGNQTCDHSTYLSCVFSARSASVSHPSANSMKSDFCAEVRAASARGESLDRHHTEAPAYGSPPWNLTAIDARARQPSPLLIWTLFTLNVSTTKLGVAESCPAR
jgi:hypothetical protein